MPQQERVYSSYLQLDLADVEPCISGPERPHDRVPLKEMKADWHSCLDNKVGFKASADQRSRLMMSIERLNHSGDRVKECRRTMLETEDLGVYILQDLHQQRQSLLHAHNTLHGVDDNIGKSKKVLTNMARSMNRNKWMIGTVVAVLVVAILLILYFKLK